MSDNSLRLVWIYPDLLSTYGDQGNALVVERRARQRGLDVTRVDVRSDQAVPTSGDIYLIGGGEDRPQRLAAERLRRDGGLNRAVSNGAIVFSVCAGYQILGHEFVNDLGEREGGLGLLDVISTRGEGERCVGDVLGDIDPHLGLPPLTGFENHQGITHLGPSARPFARVSLGRGNGTGDGTEGAYNDTVFGTYMHGPVLARNPLIADLLLKLALDVNALPPPTTGGTRRCAPNGSPPRRSRPDAFRSTEGCPAVGRLVRPRHSAPVGWRGFSRTTWSGRRPTLQRFSGQCELVCSPPAATAPVSMR